MLFTHYTRKCRETVSIWEAQSNLKSICLPTLTVHLSPECWVFGRGTWPQNSGPIWLVWQKRKQLLQRLLETEGPHVARGAQWRRSISWSAHRTELAYSKYEPSHCMCSKVQKQNADAEIGTREKHNTDQCLWLHQNNHCWPAGKLHPRRDCDVHTGQAFLDWAQGARLIYRVCLKQSKN